MKEPWYKVICDTCGHKKQNHEDKRGACLCVDLEKAQRDPCECQKFALPKNL